MVTEEDIQMLKDIPTGCEDIKCDDCGYIGNWTNAEEGFLICSCGGEKEINDIPKDSQYNPRLGKKQIKFWLEASEKKHLEILMSGPCDLDIIGDIIKTAYQRKDYIN